MRERSHNVKPALRCAEGGAIGTHSGACAFPSLCVLVGLGGVGLRRSSRSPGWDVVSHCVSLGKVAVGYIFIKGMHGPFAHLLRSAHFLLFSFLVSDSSVYILHRSPLSEIHVNIVSVWLAVSSSQQ